MAEIGVMIEAQEGLTWERWRLIVSAAEELGFASLRTSDHLMSVMGVEGRPSLPTWPALTLAAELTRRIELGPMVSPMTFYRPAVLARMARAVDELSAGRLLLGVGAGWNVAEHERFGIPLPGWGERFRNLEAGIGRIHQVFANRPLRLLIGGSGERRTLPLAAREAVEWNLNLGDAVVFREKSQRLDELCRAVGRAPEQVRRSVMRLCLVGRDRAELLERVRRLAQVIPGLADVEPDRALDGLRASDQLAGTVAEVVEQMRPLAEAGVQLFLLQHFLLDDREHLELWAEGLLPAVRSMRAAA